MLTETNPLQVRCRLALAVVLLLFPVACKQQHLNVLHMPSPEYPLKARLEGMYGVVVVTVGIGTDGRVNYAIGKGANSLLAKAAEENAKGWIFEVPRRASFPLEHQIKYTFKFDKEGRPNLTPTTITDLPYAVEIIGTPAGGDNVILIPPKR